LIWLIWLFVEAEIVIKERHPILPNPDKPELNIENLIMNIHSTIFNHMMIAKISQYNFFATKCIKKIHKGIVNQ